MSQEQLQRPVTYGDVFPAAALNDGTGLVASQPITAEDASLMQCAESLAFGQTQKGGAASVMQAAAATNIKEGLLDRDAHSLVAEYGLSIAETAVPGAVMDVAYAAGIPLAGSSRPAPTDPEIAALDAITIGEALEAAAVGAGDKPIDANDARAIMSAEARATGSTMPSRGGIGAVAQSAAELNVRQNEGEQTTLSDLLMDASSALPRDKVVTQEDAQKVLEAELRGKNADELQEGGVAASLQAAANMNEKLMFRTTDVSEQLIADHGGHLEGKKDEGQHPLEEEQREGEHLFEGEQGREEHPSAEYESSPSLEGKQGGEEHPLAEDETSPLLQEKPEMTSSVEWPRVEGQNVEQPGQREKVAEQGQ